MQNQVTGIFQFGKGYKAIAKVCGTPVSQSESHYTKIKKTWNSGKHYQERTRFHNKGTGQKWHLQESCKVQSTTDQKAFFFLGKCETSR